MRLDTRRVEVADGHDLERWNAVNARNWGDDVVIHQGFGPLGARVVPVTMSAFYASPTAGKGMPA
jgi:hypothetical protein